MNRRKKSPSIEETILEHLSPNELLSMVREWYLENSSDDSEDNKLEFNIWDKVQILNDAKNKVFTVYSYVTYKNNRREYTVWNEGEYLQYEPWQLVPHIRKNPIWFKTK